MPHSERRRRSWIAQLEHDRVVLDRPLTTARERERFADAAPRLADSIHRPRLATLLEKLDPDDVARDARLGLAMARTRAVVDDSAGALTALAQAQAAGTDESRIRARITFELGAVHILQGEIAVAQEVLETGAAQVRRADDGAGDIAHLRALTLEMTGRRQEALRWYRTAVAASSRSLTPLTRVLALRNRAGAPLARGAVGECRALRAGARRHRGRAARSRPAPDRREHDGIRPHLHG